MADKIKIYHNPRCSKSRQTLEIIEASGAKPEIVLYLETPPTTHQLKNILRMLGISARELLRKSEEAYQVNNLSDTSLSETEIIKIMQAHPKLIERPIVVKGGQAIIGRPPENVKTLLN